jgi:hypothetical protein
VSAGSRTHNRLFVMKRGEVPLTAPQAPKRHLGPRISCGCRTSSKRRPQMGQHSGAAASRLLDLDGFQLVSAELVGGEWPSRPRPPCDRPGRPGAGSPADVVADPHQGRGGPLAACSDAGLAGPHRHGRAGSMARLCRRPGGPARPRDRGGGPLPHSQAAADRRRAAHQPGTSAAARRSMPPATWPTPGPRWNACAAGQTASTWQSCRGLPAPSEPGKPRSSPGMPPMAVPTALEPGPGMPATAEG